MSTTIDERPDVEVVLDIDLEANVTCNNPIGCERIAEWVYYCQGCRIVWLACSHHRARQDQWVRDVVLILGHPGFCRVCDHPNPAPIPWRLL